jgi:late competence protein required for DNA uptake (superfamily II DNA/RNA helicase)
MMDGFLSQSLIHDLAWLGSESVMEVIENIVMDSERVDVRMEIYARIRASIETFEIQKARILHRLNPSKN